MNKRTLWVLITCTALLTLAVPGAGGAVAAHGQQPRISSLAPAGAASLQDDAAESRPLEELLTPDGRLDLNTAYSGALDPTGWRMTYGDDNAPVFERADAVSSLPAPVGLWESAWGLNSNVNVIAIAGNSVYVGGYFTDAGGNANADYIAQWNGNTWYALGSGLDNTVYDIEVVGADVYVGGYFTNAGGDTNADHIARWDGSAWHNVGGGVSDYVYAIESVGADVYVGGGFLNAGGDANADYVAVWHNASWFPLRPGFASGVNGAVYALESVGPNVYVGGDFTMANGDTHAAHIARWNITDWNWYALGDGLNNKVYAIETVGANVYVGGFFTGAGGNAQANYIARWDGAAWQPLSTLASNVLTNWVGCILSVGPSLYVGGGFTNAGGNADADYIARWDGAAWSPLVETGGGGLNGNVLTMDVMGGALYVGGAFTQVDGMTGRMARWNTTPATPAWNGLSNGLKTVEGYGYGVETIVVSGSDVYVGGGFQNAGGNPAADNIARWDGSSWHDVGGGISGTVYDIVVEGPNVYVVGSFQKAGGVVVNHVARWDGVAWHALGEGVNNTALTIAVEGPDVYVGGEFDHAGGDAVGFVARWNGSFWLPLGKGLDGSVRTIAIEGPYVYAGGNFHFSDTTLVNYIARWNGVSWQPLAGGLDGSVDTIVVKGTYVYVGGSFQNAGAIQVKHIARWNGFAWQAVGNGLDGNVATIAVEGSYVYVGGFFNHADSISVSNIARWDGILWNNMSGGLNDFVSAITPVGPDIYVGGFFADAGGDVNIDLVARYGRREMRKILFDEAHDEENTIDWSRAQQMNPDHPEWIYFGKLAAKLGDEFTFTRNTSASLTSDLLANYDALLLASPLTAFSTAEQLAIQDYITRGGGVLVLGSCGNDHPANSFLSPYGLQFNIHCIFSPIPNWTGDFDVTGFANHPAVMGVTRYAVNWGQHLVVYSPADILAWTGSNTWEDSDWSDSYNSGDRTGMFSMAASYGVNCKRVAALSDNDFQDDAFDYRGNDVLMRALLRWTTGGAACPVSTISLPLIVR